MKRISAAENGVRAGVAIALAISMASAAWAQDIAIAARRGDIEAVKKMLAADPKLVNGRGDVYRIPLHGAAKSGRLAMVKLLLAKGADANARNSIGKTPLHLARSVPVMRALLAGGADPNAIASVDGAPLHVMARSGRVEAAKLLLANGAKVDAREKNRGETPLHVAARTRSLDMARLLVANKADVNAKTRGGETPAEMAAANGLTETVEFLRSRGAKVSVFTFLSIGDVKNAGALLAERPAWAKARDREGLTPLHWAAALGYTKLAGLLRRSGAPLNAVDKGDWTPLIFAARRQRIRMCLLLLRKGADPNAPGPRHTRPLHFAAWLGDVALVEALMGYGANANARDYLGRTPLDMAAAPCNVISALKPRIQR